MNKYRFTLKHDNGKHAFVVYAENLGQALKKVLNAEGCPEGAVVNIKITLKK